MQKERGKIQGDVTSDKQATADLETAVRMCIGAQEAQKHGDNGG